MAVVVLKRNLQDKEDENIRLAEREAALVRLDCPYSRDDVNHFVPIILFASTSPLRKYNSCMLFSWPCTLTTQCAPSYPINPNFLLYELGE